MGRENPENDRDEMELIPSDSRELASEKAYTCQNCGSVFNRDKAFCPACGLGIQDMQQPARYEGYTAEIGMETGSRSVRIFALLSLILGIAGPLALGVGWLLAIIFGFTALNLMRSRGGFSKEKKLAVWGISLGFFWPTAFFILFSLYSYGRASERIISRNETAVADLLTDTAVAQRFIKSGHFIRHEGRNLYASTEELLSIEHRLIPESLDGYVSGYDIQMRVKPAEGFQVTAHPERYGSTGRKSFYIDETGELRGDDIKADRTFRSWTTLPRLRDNPVYDDYDNLIAESLIFLSRRLAEEGEFERARNILSGIRTEYYMMPAAARVDEALESLERHVYEEGSRQGYRKALAMLEEGRLRDALTKLKRVKSNYEDAVIIPEVNAKIAEVEDGISLILEAEARALFELAEEFEKTGDYDSAVEKYQKIVRELDSTSYYERASSLIKAVEARKLEKRAEDLFSDIAGLKIEDSYSEAISAVNSLMNHYAQTDFVQKNMQRLQVILSTAIGEREKDNAIRAFQQANFNAAIQAGESAVEANPALREKIVPIIMHSYLRRAESLYSNQAFAEAVPYYESWMELADYSDTAEYANYLESRYNVARDKFLEGSYEEAKGRLEGLERHFGRRDEFWYMLGSISALEKDYSIAITRLRRSVSINPDNHDAWYIKAMSKLYFVQEKEDELKELLGQLFSLKRGAPLFYDINTQVTGLHSKDLEIRQLAARTGGDEAAQRRRAGLRAERDRHEAQTRQRMIAIGDSIRNNNDIREKVTDTAGLISDAYNEINSHILRTPPGRRGRSRSEFVSLFRRKRQGFEGYLKLERGLNQEMRLEENAMLNLEFALNKFAQERSFDSELRDMFRLREGITQLGMQRSIEEGREELLRAIELKISVEEHITQAVRAGRN